MREQVIQNVIQEKVIVIVRGIKTEDLIPMAEAMYEGGVRLLEITYSMNGNPADEVTAANIRMLKEHFGERMSIGAGTVLTERQVELTAEAGGEFIISPDANPDIIQKTRALGLVSMPGALTPTEAAAAHKAGADFVKLFPISDMGSSYLKAVKAPLSAIRFLAVGGIHEGNLAEYLKAGACGFGIGSNIVNKKMIESGDFEGITALAKTFFAALENAKTE